MVRIAEIVQQLILETPHLEQLLQKDLINITALAREIRPEIEKRLKKTVQTGAIVMAIKRMNFSKAIINTENWVNRNNIFGDIILRSDLEHFSYKNSTTLKSKIVELIKVVKDNREIYFSFAQGVFESTIIISQKFAQHLEEIFKGEKITNRISELSAITIKLSEENIRIPGLYYLILKNLAWENINLIEVISTAHEFTIIVEDENIDKAFSVVKNIKSKK
jgi:hypothetical protein